MFVCLAVCVGDQIVLILREKLGGSTDDGVWLATTEQHHDSLRREFPNMRSIGVLGKEVTHWQLLPADAPDFEEAALRACELIMARDPRIGKVPKSRAKKSKQTKAIKAGAIRSRSAIKRSDTISRALKKCRVRPETFAGSSSCHL